MFPRPLPVLAAGAVSSGADRASAVRILREAQANREYEPTCMPTLPPDRGHVLTEQRHPASWDLDARSTADAIALMIDDHRRVCDAVA